MLLLALALGGEIVRLSPETWDRVPGGKEVDAIYGDWLLRNDKVVAVVAGAEPNRHAHLSLKHVQGALIDFALLSTSNDQLTGFLPHRDGSANVVQAQRIDLQEVERLRCHVAGDHAAGAHFGVVPHPFEEAQSDARRAACALRDLADAVFLDGDRKQRGGAVHDLEHGIQIVKIQPVNRAKPRPQRCGQQGQPGCRPDHCETGQVQADIFG